jgi:hypothetical protein
VLEVRTGIALHGRYGRLGFGPNSGGGGSPLYLAGGLSAEVNVPYRGGRLGVHGFFDVAPGSFPSWMFAVGPRWHTGKLVFGLDVLYTHDTRYVYPSNPAMYAVDREVGGMVVVEYDGAGAVALTAAAALAGVVGLALGANRD